MAPQIDSYRFGEMVVDGISYRQDLIIFPDFVRDSWWRTQGHEVNLEDLTEILDRTDVGTIIIGQGSPGLMKMMPEAVNAIEGKGWDLIVEATTQAWKTYNELSSAGNVIGAFHLTC